MDTLLINETAPCSYRVTMEQGITISGLITPSVSIVKQGMSPAYLQVTVTYMLPLMPNLTCTGFDVSSNKPYPLVVSGVAK